MQIFNSNEKNSLLDLMNASTRPLAELASTSVGIVQPHIELHANASLLRSQEVST